MESDPLGRGVGRAGQGWSSIIHECVLGPMCDATKLLTPFVNAGCNYDSPPMKIDFPFCKYTFFQGYFAMDFPCHVLHTMLGLIDKVSFLVLISVVGEGKS